MIWDEYVGEIIPEPNVVNIFYITKMPYPLPGALPRRRGVVWRLSILCAHKNLGWLDRPSRPTSLEPRVAFPRNGQTPPEGEAIVHLGLPILPLHALVGGRPAVYQVGMISEQPPYQGRRHDDQEGHGAHAYVGLDAVGEEDEVVVPRLLRVLPQGEDAAAGSRILRYHPKPQRTAVRRQQRRRKQQQEEPMLVPVPDAVVNEDAVVVEPGDAALADGAVLGPRRLQQVAGPAFLARVEDGEIVGVKGHVVRVRLRRDDARVAECRQVQKYVRQNDGDCGSELVAVAQSRPCAWQIQKLADRQQQDVEDQHGRMSPIPDIVPK